MQQLFGKNLRKLREERNITQKELAEHLGVTGRTIGYYESSDRFPPPETINRIADFFNVSIDWLFGRTNVRIPIVKVTEKFNGNYEANSSENDLISLKELQEFINQKRKGNIE